MTLSLKNYKGFEKRPYCNAHCPQAKATTVADTPEIRRLAENTRIQSQAKYHEDFEKSRGKGFTAIADDPETLRIKNTSKIISNVSYHGELERKKQMEEKRVFSGPEEVHNNNYSNNNNIKHQNRNNGHLSQQMDSTNYQPHNQQANNYLNNHGQYPSQSSQHQKLQQQLQQQQLQQQHLVQKQHQQLYKQQQQQQQHPLHYHAQDNGGQANPVVINRQPQRPEGQVQQQVIPKHIQPQQYPTGHPHHHQQQQQQFVTRQQQQRQSLDANMPMSRQPSKQSINNNNPQVIKHQMNPQQQQQIKYLPDAMGPPHILGPGHQMIPPSAQLAGVPNGQRLVSTTGLIASSQAQHHMIHGFNPQMGMINGVMPKQQQQQQQQHFLYTQPPPPRHMIHPNQIQSINHQVRPAPQQLQHPQNHQIPNRVFRAMYDYVANDVDEVSFFENDILTDCVNVDGNWLIGKVARSGQTGMLPANYVAEYTN